MPPGSVDSDASINCIAVKAAVAQTRATVAVIIERMALASVVLAMVTHVTTSADP